MSTKRDVSGRETCQQSEMCQGGRHVNKARCVREGDTSTKRDVSGRVVELNMLGMGSRRGYNWVTGQSDIYSKEHVGVSCPEVSSPAQ